MLNFHNVSSWMNLFINNYLLADSTTPTTTLMTDMTVITPKDFEEACKQPVVIGTVITMLAMLPVNIIGMYALFIKIDQMFNPHRLAADQRRRFFANRIGHKK
jgi:hypothetical protein